MKTLKNTGKRYILIYYLIIVGTIVCLSNCTTEVATTAETLEKKTGSPPKAPLLIYTAGYTINGDGNHVPCYWREGSRTDLSVLSSIMNGRAEAIQVVQTNLEIDIYAAGYTQNSAGDYVPCYWKNGERTDLSVAYSNKSGFAYDIQVVNEDIYVAGFTTNNENFTIPCYWENGVRMDLPVPEGHKGGEAYAIQVLNDSVHVAGRYLKDYSLPCKWADGLRQDVSNATQNAEAYAIQVTENNTYITGYNEQNNGDAYATPCYWDITTSPTNSISLTKPFPEEHGRAYAIQVDENGPTVYNAGYVNNNSSISVPCYWINEDFTLLPRLDESKSGIAYAIQINRGDIYTAGYTTNNTGFRVPCYWKNNIRFDLPRLNSIQNGEANDMYILEIQ